MTIESVYSAKFNVSVYTARGKVCTTHYILYSYTVYDVHFTESLQNLQNSAGKLTLFCLICIPQSSASFSRCILYSAASGILFSNSSTWWY